MERGYRRFGEYFFAPVCKDCKACKSIRQDVNAFSPTRSQKRILAKNQNTQVTLSTPSLSEAKLELYNRYHFVMSKKKQWKYKSSDEVYYRETFVDGAMNFGYELCYYAGEKLIGVGYMDVLDAGVSAIYFFYDHEFSHLSLGVFNILMHMKLAKACHIPYFYPGYWINQHHSLGYKSNFKPFEVLEGEPDLFDLPFYAPHRSENEK